MDSGTPIDAVVSRRLLESIFYPYSPLHDGAVILSRDRIVAAACLLPLSINPDLPRDLGTRHRAAVGATEEGDAIAIVVSEEIGAISLAVGGEITRNLDGAALRRAADSTAEAAAALRLGRGRGDRPGRRSGRVTTRRARGAGWRCERDGTDMRKWILHNLGLKLLSVFLAIFLWVVVLGEQKVDVTLNVPLMLNISTALTLVSDLPDSLEVHLRGPKTLVTSLAPREVTFVSPLASSPRGRTSFRSGRIWSGCRAGFRWSTSPRTGSAWSWRPWRELEIEVSPRLEGEPAAGFVVRRVISVPARVRMSGPTSEIRRLTQVRTLPVSLSGQMRSFSAQVLLEPVGRLIRIQDGAPISVEVEIDAKRS